MSYVHFVFWDKFYCAAMDDLKRPVDQPGLKLPEVSCLSLLSAGIKAYTTTPDFFIIIIF